MCPSFRDVHFFSWDCQTNFVGQSGYSRLAAISGYWMQAVKKAVSLVVLRSGLERTSSAVSIARLYKMLSPSLVCTGSRSTEGRFLCILNSKILQQALDADTYRASK